MAVRQMDDELLAEIRDRVSRRVTEWRPGAQLVDLRTLSGGTSSLTFLVHLEGVADHETPVVLKVSPPGLEAVRNRDVLRQARLQKALQGGERQLAPDALFSDPGAPPDVPQFMAMNLVVGECLEPVLLPAGEKPSPSVVRARYLDAARVLACLHSVVPAEVGLDGEPVISLGDEIDRWTRAFETLPEELRGDFPSAAQALHATVPEALPPVVNHGDYRLGNMLCEGDRVTAIIDWEIWTIGDPRVDISWLTYFTDDAEHPAVEPGARAGTPTSDEVLDAYELALGRTLPNMVWFHALTRYKEAAATGLLLKRSFRNGDTLSDTMARMVPALPRLLQETIDLTKGA